MIKNRFLAQTNIMYIPVKTYDSDIKLPPHLYMLAVFSLLSANKAACHGQSPRSVLCPNVTSGVCDPIRRPHLVSVEDCNVLKL